MDAVIVGSCNTDFCTYAKYLPQEGETLIGYKFETGCGGKGANQCVAAAKLGAQVAMVGKVGDDIFGKQFLDNFEACHVDCKHVTTETEAATGMAAISVAENGANCIIVVPGANNLITREDVRKAESLITACKVVVCQNEIPPETTLAALKIAQKNGVTSIFNPAPADKSLSSEFFSVPDIFCVNETEAELFIGKTVNNVESAVDACKVLLEIKNCKSVIVTLGKTGCVYQGHKNEKAVHIPSPVVNAVDTTGAGDSFIGSLAYFMAKKPDMKMEERIGRACKIASISVQKPGTAKSFPYASDVPSDIMH